MGACVTNVESLSPVARFGEANNGGTRPADPAPWLRPASTRKARLHDAQAGAIERPLSRTISCPPSRDDPSMRDVPAGPADSMTRRAAGLGLVDTYRATRRSRVLGPEIQKSLHCLTSFSDSSARSEVW